MSYEHNLMAHQVSAQLLTELRSGVAAWAGGCLTSKSTLWQGVADWPRPDIAFQDPSPRELVVRSSGDTGAIYQITIC